MEKAYFALGCFWGVQEYFDKLPGIHETNVGYMGGASKDANYENIGDHAETTEIIFDPKLITYSELLDHFWIEHDPTFFYKGQYRSAIFCDSPVQFEIAKTSLVAKQATLDKPIVTEISTEQIFVRAEDYHQKYFAKHRL
jgi:methionine-S-sulfoxide reductase